MRSIILRALQRARKDLICSSCELEGFLAICALGVAEVKGLVWVMRQGESAIRALDFSVSGGAFDVQQIVVVPHDVVEASCGLCWG